MKENYGSIKITNEELDNSIPLMKYYFSSINIEEMSAETTFAVHDFDFDFDNEFEVLMHELSDSIMGDVEQLSDLNVFKSIFEIILIRNNNKPYVAVMIQKFNESELTKSLMRKLVEIISDKVSSDIADRCVNLEIGRTVFNMGD